MKAQFFYDNLTPAGDKPIRVMARISVLSPKQGGRSTPFTQKYRPNHNFGSPDNLLFYIGQIEIPEGSWIHPGEIHDLIVTFLNVQGLADNLQVGREWRIQEGSKLIATAKVLSVLGET